ncbi:MAG: zonular occludens toxin domain-containing protein, partial [Candidatus Gracilibacteria bacterium]|nr:zonular occludens toxin domain-containing protein [Candidatus Gracilibacteria bacterium]
FKKGLKPVDDRFGVYFITGRQGSGKSYYAVDLLLQQDKFLLNKVYSNIHSLKIPDININYFNKVTDIYFNEEEYCVFLLDEIARKYDRNSKTDTQFYAWLNQSRKKKRIVILVTQEWRELPMWIRRPAKFMISTKRTPILYKFGFYTSIVGDAENMVFNKDEGEYECPPIQYIIYKRNEITASYYDTFEAVNQL